VFSPFPCWLFPLSLSPYTTVVVMHVTSGHTPNISRPFGSAANRFIYCWFHFRFSFPCLPPRLVAPGGSRLNPAESNLSLNDPDCSPQRFGHYRDLITEIHWPTMFNPLAPVVPHRSLCFCHSILPGDPVSGNQQLSDKMRNFRPGRKIAESDYPVFSNLIRTLFTVLEG